jgi:hypothetical protein
MGRRPYAVQVTPCRPERIGLFPSPARVLLTISDLDAGIGPGVVALRKIFALSRAQVAVAVLLAEGRESREIASTAGDQPVYRPLSARRCDGEDRHA